MNEDLDLQKLAEIPDPFPDSASLPQRRVPAPSVYSPARSRVQDIRAVAVTAALFYVAAWPLFFRRRPDLSAVRPVQLALEVGVPLAIAGMAAGVLGRRGPLGLGESRARILTLVMASPVVFAIAMLVSLSAADVDRFWHHTMACMLVTALLAAGPLVMGVYAFRNAFATLSVWRTTALGIASGALAAAAIAFACPVDNAWHVLVGHGTMMLVAGALGGLLGQRVCRA